MSKAGEAAAYIVAIAVLVVGSILYWFGVAGVMLAYMVGIWAFGVFAFWMALSIFIEMIVDGDK